MGVERDDFDSWSSELYNRPGHLIRRCYQIVMALYIEEAQGIGLTQLQYVVLRVINQYPGESQRRLGELAAVDRTTVGLVVNGLEAKRLIVRKCADNDRRLLQLELTRLGHQKLEAVDSRMQRLQARILAPLTESERSTFIQQLRKIVLANNHYSRAPHTRRRARKAT